jgi:very-short-patch-repair endonuclease
MRAQHDNERPRRPEGLRLAARVAGVQHGVVTGRQLRGLGLSRGQIGRELANGRIHRLHRGIYLLGPLLSQRARELAAVLACSPNAVLSHRSATFHWKLLPYPADPGPVHVTVAGRNPRHPGIRVHRANGVQRCDICVRDAIPMTTPTRTIIDVAADSAPEELEQAVAEAFALRLTSRPAILALIDRHPHRPGTRALRTMLEARAPARTRSPAEERLLRLVRAAGLPEPEVNARLEPWEVDFLWREERLVVEVDGYASHSSPEAFERDRRNTAELQDAGFLVHRVTAKAVQGDPGSVVATIARMVGRARVRPGQ